MDEISEIEAYGPGLYAYYVEYLHQHAEGAVPLTLVEGGTLGNEPLSFMDWLYGNPGNINYWGESDDDVDMETVEATPSGLDYAWATQWDPLPGNGPSPMPGNGPFSTLPNIQITETQAFCAGAPGDPHEPEEPLAPGEYGPPTALQSLVAYHTDLIEHWPASYESIEQGQMMQHDTDICDDEQLLLSAISLINDPTVCITT